MDEKRMVVIGVTVVIAVATITILAVTLSSSSPETPQTTTNETEFHPLLIISLDGFRADYLGRDLTPTLWELIQNGVFAPYMIPSYPTVTFPNHYTIVTGLLPESHGIIANSFYDPEFNASFSMGNCEGRWWGGEPMWVTLKEQDKRSATYFWPGSDCNVSGIYPDDWFPYDGEVPFEDRIDTVLQWLSRPIETRPHWVSLYFDQPDHDGHQFGPDTPEVDKKIEVMDSLIKRLMTGLRHRGLDDTVNVMIVSDHGMATVTQDQVIQLNDMVPDIETRAQVYAGPFSRIRMMDSSEEVVKGMLDQLVCQSKSLRAYAKKDLPRRFHFHNNDRIEDIVLDLNGGYITNVTSNRSLTLGQHGYDNYVFTMNALFIAAGPDFQSGVVLDPFPNTELYHLMCHLTQVEPAPHNGTIGSLNAALLDPVPIPELPQTEDTPPAKFPEKPEDVFSISGCPGKLSMSETWLTDLNFSAVDMEALQSLHLPWGMPLLNTNFSDTNLVLLHHQDHVTAYSNTLKTPLWTSVTLNSRRLGSPTDTWYSDVRLTEETTPTCESYNNTHLDAENYTMFPLFPPEMSRNSTLHKIPFLVSNAVPATEKMVPKWMKLMKTLRSLARSSRPLNIIMGPVFNDKVFKETEEQYPILPTDLFALATWCRVPGTKLPDCDSHDLRAIGFIYPETHVAWNCMGDLAFAVENSGRVRDVEGITGLSFFTNLSPYNRTHLLLQASTHPSWPQG